MLFLQVFSWISTIKNLEGCSEKDFDLYDSFRVKKKKSLPPPSHYDQSSIWDDFFASAEERTDGASLPDVEQMQSASQNGLIFNDNVSVTLFI